MIHAMQMVKINPAEPLGGDRVGPVAYTDGYVGLVLWQIMDWSRVAEGNAAVREIAARFPDRVLVSMEPDVPPDVATWLLPRNREIGFRLHAEGKLPGFVSLGINDDHPELS